MSEWVGCVFGWVRHGESERERERERVCERWRIVEVEGEIVVRRDV